MGVCSRWAVVGLVVGASACFTGGDLEGAPCIDDAACGSDRLVCVDGSCQVADGEESSDGTDSETSASTSMSTTTSGPTSGTTDDGPMDTTGSELCGGLPQGVCQSVCNRYQECGYDPDSAINFCTEASSVGECDGPLDEWMGCLGAATACEELPPGGNGLGECSDFAVEYARCIAMSGNFCEPTALGQRCSMLCARLNECSMSIELAAGVLANCMGMQIVGGGDCEAPSNGAFMQCVGTLDCSELQSEASIVDACEMTAGMVEPQCVPFRCGDGIRLPSFETCDDGDRDPMNACNNDCSNGSSMCGNSMVEAGEDCDGTDLGGSSCEDLGYSGGMLNCTDCSFDTWDCTGCTLDTCGTECVDLQTSRDHCGACDDPCDLGTYCSSGNCVDGCQGDEDCPAGETCSTGTCQGGGGSCRVYVDIDSPATTPTGDDWATAYPSLPEAVTAATQKIYAMPGGSGTCDLWVAEGTYYALVTDSTDMMSIIEGLSVYGGFAGTEDSLSQRDLAAHRTTVDGRLNGFSNLAVQTIFQLTGGTRLDGLEIRVAQSGLVNLGTGNPSMITTIANCELWDSAGKGLSAYGDSTNTLRVEDSVFHDLVDPVDVNSFGTFEFRRNRVVDNPGTQTLGVGAANIGVLRISDARDVLIQDSDLSGTGPIIMNCAAAAGKTQRLSRMNVVSSLRVQASGTCNLSFADSMLLNPRESAISTLSGLSSASLTNLTISDAGSRLIEAEFTNTRLQNSVLWGNLVELASVSQPPLVLFSDIEGGFSGTGNIAADPKFVGELATGAWETVTVLDSWRTQLTDAEAAYAPGALVGSYVRTGTHSVIDNCGDGQINGSIPGYEDEECDEGNDNGGPDCTTRCTIPEPLCGNGLRERGEQCDDGNDAGGDGCSASCQHESCGNGVKEAWEACDGNDFDGLNCGTVLPGATPFACRADCTIDTSTCSTCGDGQLGLGEGCDDNNTNPADGCDACRKTYGCGDGIVVPPEECDDGNTTGYDGCRSDCTFNECGDGIRWLGIEDCDDGNRTDGDGCSADCKDEAKHCGNALGGGLNCSAPCYRYVVACGEIFDPVEGMLAACEQYWDFVSGETADCSGAVMAYYDCISGATCGAYASSCSQQAADVEAKCLGSYICGNGIVDAGEACDDGLANGASAGCSATCTITAPCGDGNIDGSEQCDDGDNDSGDGCSASCRLEPEAPAEPVTNDAVEDRWYLITDNGATTLTVDGDGTGRVLVGDSYTVYDFRPSATSMAATSSPLIDAADGDVASSTDLLGQPRFDAHGPGGSVGSPAYVDIGAFEFNPP